MNRAKPQTTTPLVLRKPVKFMDSELELKRKMAASILAGMMANPRREKFDEDDLVLKAIDCANKIIGLTS